MKEATQLGGTLSVGNYRIQNTEYMHVAGPRVRHSVACVSFQELIRYVVVIQLSSKLTP